MPSLTFSVIPLFYRGLTEGLNPCAFTAIVLFLIFLSILGKTPHHILVLGTHFILAYLVITLVIFMGLLDLIIGSIKIQIALRYVFLLLGVAAIGLGIVHLWDWWWYKKEQDVKHFIIKKYPILLFSDELISGDAKGSGDFSSYYKNKNVWQRPVFGAWVGGIVTALLGSLWPPSYMLTSHYPGLYTAGEQFTTFTVFVVYTFLFILPMIVVFAVLLYLTHTEKILQRRKEAISLVKIVFSALLLGVGAGLIYFFI